MPAKCLIPRLNVNYKQVSPVWKLRILFLIGFDMEFLYQIYESLPSPWLSILPT